MYVMLCYVMLSYVMSCYVMLCYVMLCYVMLCYVERKLGGENFRVTDDFMMEWGVKDAFKSNDNRQQ